MCWYIRRRLVVKILTERGPQPLHLRLKVSKFPAYSSLVIKENFYAMIPLTSPMIALHVKYYETALSAPSKDVAIFLKS